MCPSDFENFTRVEGQVCFVFVVPTLVQAVANFNMTSPAHVQYLITCRHDTHSSHSHVLDSERAGGSGKREGIHDIVHN
jgi:hypothetical protein